MEEKKNNALEKAEKAQVDSPKKLTKREKGNLRRNQAIERKNAIKRERKSKRQEQKAQKRLEVARIKMHRKEEKEKLKLALKRDKSRQKAQREQRREQLKAERAERIQMLKNESKKERERRIYLEKQARRDERQRIRQENEKRRKQIALERAEIRRAKQQERAEKRKIKQRNKDRRKGYGGWLAAVISLGVATLILASVLTATLLMPTASDGVVESAYQKAFYDTVEQVDNIDLNLSKVLATKDSGAIQKYLVDTAINSELAENDIQELPLKDESKFYTAKLINQIGDYAKYLNNKLIDGQPLTTTEKENLTNLYQANLALKKALQQMTAQIQSGYSFKDLEKAMDNDYVLQGFNQLQNLSVQFPELIYDGPFSDGQNERDIKGLSGEEITSTKAKEKFINIFAHYKIEQVEVVGQTDGEIVCYNVQGQAEGLTVYAQISKKGGHLIMFASAGDCNQTLLSKEQAIEKAQAFLKKNELTSMKEVWINLSNNIYTINFAGEQNGIVLYPDLVKVRVCAQTGNVLGLEAKSYYTNHVQRSLSKPVLSAQQAKQKLFDGLNVNASRLVVVPVGNASESLCYEFFGEHAGQTYYVYIDATNGRQVQMFRVVESTEGEYLQ